MMWLGVYQSARCWLLSGPWTVATNNLTVPRVQIGWRPMASSTAAMIATMAKATAQYLRGMSGTEAEVVLNSLWNPSRASTGPGPVPQREDEAPKEVRRCRA